MLARWVQSYQESNLRFFKKKKAGLAIESQSRFLVSRILIQQGMMQS